MLHQALGPVQLLGGEVQLASLDIGLRPTRDHQGEQGGVGRGFRVPHRFGGRLLRVEQDTLLPERDPEVMVGLGQAAAVAQALIREQGLAIQAPGLGHPPLQVGHRGEVVGGSRRQQEVLALARQLRRRSPRLRGLRKTPPLERDRPEEIQTPHSAVVVGAASEAVQSVGRERLPFPELTQPGRRGRDRDSDLGLTPRPVLRGGVMPLQHLLVPSRCQEGPEVARAIGIGVDHHRSSALRLNKRWRSE